VSAPHGTKARYSGGCKCDECRHAQRLYQREYRDRVTQLQATPTGPAGPVELAVQAQLEELSAAVAQPALAAAALCMGRVLDGRVPTPKPQACAKLMDVLDRLKKGSELGKPRLAAVRAMSGKGGPA
jgi:hypothetical protein